MDDFDEGEETTLALKMSWRQVLSLGAAMVCDYLAVTSDGFKALSHFIDADDEWRRERKDMENAVREAIEEIASGTPLEGN